MSRLLILMALGILLETHPVRSEEPFDYFQNSWSLVGMKDYLDGARVTPKNEVQLADKQQLTISFGTELIPLSRRQTKTLKDGCLPIVLVTAEQTPVRYDFTIWASPLPSVGDWKAAYDGPAEGENFLVWVRVVATNSGTSSAQAKVRGMRTGSKTTQPVEIEWTLSAGESKTRVIRLPFAELEGTSFEDAAAQMWYSRTVAYWRQLLASGTHLETPDTRVNNALRASHVYQFISNDHGVVQAGEGFYDELFIRDGAYQVQQYEEAGFLDTARQSLEAFRKAQRSDGRFESQEGQLDANGQALWAFWQFFKIAADRKWLEDVYPSMVRATDWIIRTRKQTPADSPFAGLLPNALADGEFLWDGKYHIVGYDFWNLRGMICTRDAAQVLGKTADVNRLEDDLQQYRAAIDAAWQKTGLPHFPPSWEKAGTHWGNTETLWPTPLFDADDPRVIALIHEVRNNFGGGFHEGTIRWHLKSKRPVIHPYMSSYTTMASLDRNEDEQVVQDLYWYLLHSTAAHSFPEGIFYRERTAWNDTIPHATGASNYAFILRHMLIHEKGNELHLLSAVPDWWLDEGKVIRVQRAPTHFGEIDLLVHGRKEGVDVRVKLPQREPPRRVVIHLPESRPAKDLSAGLDVVLRPDQSQRWDLPTVIREYEQIKPPADSGSIP